MISEDGVELALARDVWVCTPDATFAESGVGIGLFGARGGTSRLPDVVGRGVAMDLALSGRVVGSEAALRTGLVSRVVEDPRTVAEAIAANDSDALQAIAGSLGDAGHRDERDERERAAFARLVAARTEKRND